MNRRTTKKKQKMSSPNVAFCRTLKLGMRGNDVVAHKRAVSRAFPSLYPWWKQGFTPYYGQHFQNAVKGAQLVMKLAPTGQIDKATHEALERRHRANHPEDWAFDAWSIHLAAEFCENFQKLSVRQRIVDAGYFWYGHRGNIAYSQYRPMQLKKPPQVPTMLDCSSFVTNCHYAGGAPDPNGRGYDGIGYTGTLIANGVKTTIGKLLPGDAIFYGFASGHRPGFPTGSPTHVAMWVGNGLVLSMGSYPMKLLPYNYRSDINAFVQYKVEKT